MFKKSFDKTGKVLFMITMAAVFILLILGESVFGGHAQKVLAETQKENISAALPCAVTHFSQHTDYYGPELYTASCIGSDTMASGGCAITSLAMLLKYYGVNTTPRLLDDKLGVDGCPLSSHWGDLPLVDGPTSSLSYVGAQDGTLSSLSTILANDLAAGHPVVLHMALSSGVNHYVLAISGSGTSASNYQIVDSSDGVQKSLQEKYNQGYTVQGIIRYSGIPACQNNIQAPINLTATMDLQDKVVLTWDAVPNATSYEVWRYTTNVWDAAERLSKGIVTPTYDDTTGTIDVNYAYWVAACNSNGCTVFSEHTRGMRTSIVPPAAPTDVRASNNLIEKVNITWSPIANATRYEIWRNPNNDISSEATLLISDATSPYEDITGLIAKSYVYWVKACNGDVCSDFSNSNYGNSVLSTPVCIDASDGTIADYLRVGYCGVSQATGYELWRNTSNNLGNAQLILTDNGSPFEDNTAIPGIIYYYWVRAFNDYGTSGYSEPDSGYLNFYIYLPLVIKQ